MIGPGLESATIEHERNGALLAWYGSTGRDLPWRGTRHPYPILVSEVMLQQTQVQRVIPFFERFLTRFPTVESLAAAPLAEVLAAWNGLGYNSRAQRLHAAAGRIVEDGWPDDVTGLESLPGVGPYTARAVACFALGHTVVPVDTNIRRVLSRWHGEPLAGSALQAIADQDANGSAASAWTQAVMDLASGLCKPRSPQCTACPVTSWCAGPDVYVPPVPQARFEGSARQLRGALIRRLVAGPADLETLSSASGFQTDHVREALVDLEAEGMVEETDTGYRLPE